MSIVVKKVGRNRYAYLAQRRGGTVVHKYLGPVADAAVSRKIEQMRAEEGIPRKFEHLFWDTNPAKISVRKNSQYVIERVLEFGDLDAVQWAQKMYPTRTIIEICESSRRLSEKSRHFWRLWFGCTHPA